MSILRMRRFCIMQTRRSYTLRLHMAIEIEKSQNIIFQYPSLENEHISSHNYTVRTFPSINNNNN
jgi:hypothetical protein